MKKETLAEFIEDSVIRDEFLKFLDREDLNYLTFRSIESINPMDILNDIVKLQNDELRNYLLFYLYDRKFGNGKSTLLSLFSYIPKNSSVDRMCKFFISNILSDLQEKYELFKSKRQKVKKTESLEKHLDDFKNSLDDSKIDAMFDNFEAQGYKLIGDFARAQKLTSSMLKVLETTLKDKGRFSELGKLAELRQTSEKVQRMHFERIRNFVYSNYRKIVHGVLMDDGSYRKFTQLEYLLGYHVDKYTFLKYMDRLKCSEIGKSNVIKFYQPIEAHACSKEYLFKDKYIFAGYEVTDDDKNKAYDLLIKNDIKPTCVLFKQALKMVI